ncbi:hypothetical protein CHUAL_007423 [Chamberlinius hualienensis]
MVVDTKPKCFHSVRCIWWNFLVCNVAFGIIVLILAQLVSPSMAFVVLKRPFYDPGQRSKYEEENQIIESENERLLVSKNDILSEESHTDDDDDDPKLQNIDLKLLRQHLINSLGLQDVADEPQITINPEEMARALETYRKRVREREIREKRDLMGVSQTSNDFNEQLSTDKKEVYTYFTHGVPVAKDNYSAQKITFRLGNLTQFLRMNERMVTSRITTATLHLNWPKVAGCPNLYLYNQNMLLLKQFPNTLNSTWITIDISDSIRRWIQLTYQQPINFLVSCDTLDGVGGQTTTQQTHPHSESLVKLEVRLKSVKFLNRMKRYADYNVNSFPFKAEPSNCTNGENSCCRKSINITMKDLQMQSRIIYPKQFPFYYCKGKCRNATNHDNLHALIQHYMHQHGKRKKKLPKLCCTASKLGTMEVLFVDTNPETKESGIKVVTWKNIIVESCDCA